eukprot:scaffold144790_cov36-Tisochrysis_lutea.AAC.4
MQLPSPCPRVRALVGRASDPSLSRPLLRSRPRRQRDGHSEERRPTRPAPTPTSVEGATLASVKWRVAQGPGVDKNGAEEVDPGVDGVLANRADVRGRGGFVDRLELVDGAVDGRGGGVWAEAVADEALRWP